MTIKVPLLEDFSKEARDSVALGQKLASDKEAARLEVVQLRAASRTEIRESRIARIAAGEAVQENTNNKAALAEATARHSDLEDACVLQKHHDDLVRRKAGAELCKSIAPQWNELAKSFSASLVQLHRDLVTMKQLELALRAQQIGFFPPILNLDTDRVFGSPFNRASDFAILMRECVQRGYLKDLPKELKNAA